MTGPRPDLMSSFLKAATANRENETTKLSPGEEFPFKIWAMSHGIDNPDDPREFYDYRGAFKARVEPQISPVDNKPHWPDTFKQHGHPTFSQESRYSAGKGDGGSWAGTDGETYAPMTLQDSIGVLRALMKATPRKP